MPPFSVTGCPCPRGGQALPPHSYDRMEAEPSQPAALGSPPGVCPPSGHCKAVPLRNQDKLKDFGSKRLARSPARMGYQDAQLGRASPPHPPQAPGRREGAASPRARPCRHCPHLSGLPTDHTARTPPPRGLRGPSAAVTAVRWAETLTVQGGRFQSRQPPGWAVGDWGSAGPP